VNPEGMKGKIHGSGNKKRNGRREFRKKEILGFSKSGVHQA